MKTFLIRGSFANQFELQNYEPISKDFNITVVTSNDPITPINMPTLKLSSPHDMPSIPFKNAFLNRLMTDPHWLIDLESHIEGADIVHVAETYYGYTHQAVEMRRDGQIKRLVSTCWETIPHNNESLGSKGRWKQEARDTIDLFFTPTVRAKHALIQEGVREDKIAVVRVGVDTKRFTKIDINEKVNNILFVGRFVDEKGVEDALHLAKRFRNIHFRFVGSGPILPYGLNTSVSRSPYEHIHKEYQDADILIMPSRSTDTWEEQYGMVLVEAMSSGLPILAADTGSISEVLGNAGILASNTESMEYELSELISNPQKRFDLSQIARNRAEAEFDRVKISEQIKTLYNSLL